MAGFTLDLSDRFFLRHYSSLEQVGLYSLGYRLGEIIFFVTAAVQLAWPQFVFANRKAPNAKELFSYATTYYLAGMLFLVLGLSAVAPELVHLMAAPEYRAAAPVVPIVALAGLCEGLRYVVTIGIAYQKRPDHQVRRDGRGRPGQRGAQRAAHPDVRDDGRGLGDAGRLHGADRVEFVVSRRFYPIPYQHARIAKLCGVVTALYLASRLVPAGVPAAVAAENGDSWWSVPAASVARPLLPSRPSSRTRGAPTRACGGGSWLAGLRRPKDERRILTWKTRDEGGWS
jgi:hypothetical protein